MERSVRAILRADVGQYTSAMGQAADATEQVGKAAERTSQQTRRSHQEQTSSARSFSQRLSQHAKENEQAWQSVGTALAVVGGAVTAVGLAGANAGIQYNSLRQTATQALTAVTGSAEEATAQMRRLDHYGQNSWLMRDSLIRAQQQMTGFGIETGKVVPYMEALAEGVAAAGGSNQDFEELARIMGQVNSQGKFTAETFNQFGMRGIDAAQMIADAMGTTAGRIRDDVTSGTLDAQAALDALAEGIMVNFEGSSDLVRNTFDGVVANVQAAWRDIFAIVTTPLVDPEGGGLLVDLVDQVGNLLFAIRDLPDPLLQVIGLAGLLGGAAITAAAGFLLLYPRVMETWNHLGNMGRVGPAAQNAIRKVGSRAGRAAVGMGKFAAATAAAYGAVRLARTIADAITGFDAAAASVDLMTSRMRDLGGETSGFDAILKDLDLRNFTDFGDSVRDLANLGGLDKLVHDLGISATRSEVAAEAFENAGQALAGMAEVDLSNAQESFRSLWEEAGATDQAATDLLELMPAYRDELEKVALDSGLAATETEILLLATGLLTPEIEAAVAATSEYDGVLEEVAGAQAAATEALNEWRQMVRDAADAFPGLIDGYEAVAEANEDGIVSMQGWIDQMAEQNEAIQNWQENTLEVTGRIRDDMPADMQAAADGMMDELLALGPEGAAAIALLKDSSDEELLEMITLFQERGVMTGDGWRQGVEDARNPQLQVEIDDAEAALDAYLGSVANSEEYVTIDGRSLPAENVLAGLEAAILASDEPVTINGNEVPAEQVLDALMTAISEEEEFVSINGDRVSADQVTGELLAWIGEQGASVNVDANTEDAEANIRSMMNRWDGSTITFYQRMVARGEGPPAGHPAGRAEGGPIYRATGGRIYGPGTTTSDSIPAFTSSGKRYRLSHDEHIVSAYEVQQMGGHAAVEKWRGLARTGDLRAALAPGYREGGRPGGTPGLSPLTVTPPPATAGGVTYNVHLHGIPADQPEAFASAALFEMRRFDNDSAYVRTVTHA